MVATAVAAAAVVPPVVVAAKVVMGGLVAMAAVRAAAVVAVGKGSAVLVLWCSRGRTSSWIMVPAWTRNT